MSHRAEKWHLCQSATEAGRSNSGGVVWERVQTRESEQVAVRPGRSEVLTAQKNFEIGHEVRERLMEARVRTDELFDLVRPDSLYERPIPERHRIIFYLGHLEAFDWNLLGERVWELNPFSSSFDRLLAFGIDPVGGGLPSDQPADWPAVGEILRYSQQVRETL